MCKSRVTSLLLVALVLSASLVAPAQGALTLAGIAAARGVSIGVLRGLGALLGLGDVALANYLQVSSTSISQPHAGSLWVTSLTGTWGTFNGEVMSAYYHPSCTHTASTEGKLGLKRSTANAGTWAYSKQTRSLTGNKSYYNTLCR